MKNNYMSFDWDNYELKETYTNNPWIEGYSDDKMTLELLNNALATKGYYATEVESTYDYQMECWRYFANILKKT